MHPQPRMQNKTKHTSIVTTVTPVSPGIPRAMVLRLISRSPRRSGLFVTVVSRVFSQDLTPASRRQNHTTSPSASSAFVSGTACVHRIPPRVRADRERPSEGRDGNRYIADLGQARSGIFLQMGLDRFFNGQP